MTKNFNFKCIFTVRTHTCNCVTYT